MIKKFFKAIIMGLENCEELKGFLKFCILGAWLPALITVIIMLLKIRFDEIILAIICMSVLYSWLISAFICHCWDAMKYQEEHKCDSKTAWNATTSYGDDDF